MGNIIQINYHDIMMMNAHRIKKCRLLLSIGLFITFLTSLSLIVLHEKHIICDDKRSGELTRKRKEWQKKGNRRRRNTEESHRRDTEDLKRHCSYSEKKEAG